MQSEIYLSCAAIEMAGTRSIVESYFSCVKAGDKNVAELFHDDAQLIGLGTVVVGRPAIDQFYAASIETGRPQPSLVGGLFVEGDRVIAELLIELAGQATMHVVDLFEISGEKIKSLTYFVADHS
ncbi:unannotated protein [freshwater metagenome]|uniref:Unannotated protein n=1 Tax=freshwater metagenome TaxID=449393 RepID=A0A6J6Z1L9_9ZZZZ|nr:hypothetical protein [Actinomycetota bacterium]